MSLTLNTRWQLGLWPGAIALFLLTAVIAGSLTAVSALSDTASIITTLRDPYFFQVVRFTLWQATLSTLISVILAVPVARAYARRPAFTGRKILITLMGLPVVMPVIVAVFGIVAVYGRSGLLNFLLQPTGVSVPIELYGLTGILLAHTFFNLPLAVRLLLPAWDQITNETWRTASTLGMSSTQLFRFIEWPALSAFLPGVIVVIFLLCFTSFAVVLTLGGGPAATTIEVAIYQALRFEFDPAQAAVLALAQLLLCAGSALLLIRWMRVLTQTSGRKSDSRARPDTGTRAGRLFDFGVIGLCGIFVFTPVAALVTSGLRGPVATVLFDTDLWQAAARSLGIALTATSLAGIMALGIATTARFLVLERRQKKAKEGLLLAGSLTLAFPPMVIGTGFFLISLRLKAVDTITLLMIAVVNAVMVLPYILRSIAPVLIDSGQQYRKLCAQLGLSGWHRFCQVDWPMIRKPAAFSLALGGALSFGDMGVAALFDTTGHITLPVMLYQRMSAYRFDEAAVTALVLVLMCVALFWILDRSLSR